MNIKLLVSEIASIVMVDEDDLKMETLLADFPDWDSLAIAALLSFLDENSTKLEASSLRSAKTVGDIVNIVQEHVVE